VLLVHILRDGTLDWRVAVHGTSSSRLLSVPCAHKNPVIVYYWTGYSWAGPLGLVPGMLTHLQGD